MITQKQLVDVGKSLPHGALRVIAQRAKYSESYVCQFFNGKTAITVNNIEIYKEAMKLCRELDKV